MYSLRKPTTGKAKVSASKSSEAVTCGGGEKKKKVRKKANIVLSGGHENGISN